MDRTQIAADLAALIALNPSIVVHGDATYTGWLSSNDTDKQYLPEGSFDKYAGSVSLVADDVTSSPECKDLITVDGTAYRIMHIWRDSLNVRLKLLLRLETPTAILVSA